MKYLFLSLSALLSLNMAHAKCTADKLEEFAPAKFTVYQVDREHKFVGKTTPLVFAKEEHELSESDRLYHISHKKSPNKHCSLVSLPDSTFSLKSKEEFQVTKVESNEGVLRIVLGHEKLAHIDCKGIQTMGDLRDALEPYLTFDCKQRFKPKTVNGRLPASIKE